MVNYKYLIYFIMVPAVYAGDLVPLSACSSSSSPTRISEATATSLLISKSTPTLPTISSTLARPPYVSHHRRRSRSQSELAQPGDDQSPSAASSTPVTPSECSSSSADATPMATEFAKLQKDNQKLTEKIARWRKKREAEKARHTCPTCGLSKERLTELEKWIDENTTIVTSVFRLAASTVREDVGGIITDIHALDSGKLLRDIALLQKEHAIMHQKMQETTSKIDLLTQQNQNLILLLENKLRQSQEPATSGRSKKGEKGSRLSSVFSSQPK